MNQIRRDRLQSTLVLLQRAEDIVDHVKDEEMESVQNFPENLQASDRYIAMENAVSYMEDAIENIREAAKNIESTMNER